MRVWPRRGVLFLLPLLVRIVVHLELLRDPYYLHLFVDARIYHEIARVLADGSQAMTGPHWQPPFFPQFVSWIYRLGGPDPDTVRWVQMVLGSLGAVWVHELASRLGSARAGWMAWSIAAFAGPVVFFDLQLLPATLASFLLLATIVLLLPWLDPRTDGTEVSRLRERRTGPWGAVRVGAAGLAAGVGALTVGNLALLLPWGCGLLIWSALRNPVAASVSSASTRSSPAVGAVRGTAGGSRGSSAWVWTPVPWLFLLCGALPLLGNTVQNHRASGEILPISYNAGINFWIGNNPSYDETMGIRPGRAWQGLTAEPLRAGATGYRAQSDYFLRKSWAWASRHPSAALTLAGKKTRLFWRGDEIPRNQEIYPFRRSSRLLSALLFVRGIAFPTGVVLPLAGAGLILVVLGNGAALPVRGETSPGLRWLGGLMLFLAVSVIAFFVTSRYRIPIYPLLAIFAALGFEGLFRSLRGWRGGPGRWKGTVWAVFGLGLLASNLGIPPIARDPSSDTQYDLGLAFQEEGNLEQAKALYESALEANPENAEAHNNLAGLLLRDGRANAAREHLEAVLRRYPEDGNARLNLTRVLLSLGDVDGAARSLEPLRNRIEQDERVRRLVSEIERARARTGPGGAPAESSREESAPDGQAPDRHAAERDPPGGERP